MTKGNLFDIFFLADLDAKEYLPIFFISLYSLLLSRVDEKNGILLLLTDIPSCKDSPDQKNETSKDMCRRL